MGTKLVQKQYYPQPSNLLNRTMKNRSSYDLIDHRHQPAGRKEGKKVFTDLIQKESIPNEKPVSSRNLHKLGFNSELLKHEFPEKINRELLGELVKSPTGSLLKKHNAFKLDEELISCAIQELVRKA
jgi:hypothetical protein